MREMRAMRAMKAMGLARSSVAIGESAGVLCCSTQQALSACLLKLLLEQPTWLTLLPAVT